MKKIKWEWDGFAKHFCGSGDCYFRMSTKIGDIVVSTVGDYKPNRHHPDDLLRKLGIKPKDRYKSEMIGCDRYYETMTFKSTDANCECCDWQADTGAGELDWYKGYDTAREARKGHLEICEEVESFLTKGEKNNESTT